MFTVSDAGNTNYIFKTEKEASDFFDKHAGKMRPMWMFREAPFKMLREYTPE